jgi:hypothetical protein
MESKKINQLATELSPVLSDLTIIGDPATGISKKITLSQMASLFTGTVEEYPNLASFPLVGTADTIYIALDTNVLYRWNTGTNAYVELSPNIINSLVFNDANGFDGTIALVGSVATLTITTALTTGSVGFIGASGVLLQDNANFFWDDTNNRLGLGTNAPTTAIDVFGSGIIGRLNGTSTNNAFLGFSSAGSNKWSIGNVQSDHRFRIYNDATTSELVSVLQTGEFGIGIANPTTKLHIDGGASALIANLDANVSVAKSLSFRSDNSNRINLEVSGTESGSNAGANFFLRAYSDAGALLNTPLTITRATGAATFISSITANGGLIFDTPQNVSVSGSIGFNSTEGLFIYGKAGSSYDFKIYNGSGNAILQVPTSTVNVQLLGALSGTSASFNSLTAIFNSGSGTGSLGIGKWLTQPETSAITRTYFTGSDSSTYGRWEIYRSTSTTPAIIHQYNSDGTQQMHGALSGTSASFSGNTNLATNGGVTRIGLGTTTFVTDEFLTIASNSDNHSQIINVKEQNAAASGTPYLVLRKSDDTYIGLFRRIGTDNAMLVTGNSYLALGGGNVEHMRITTSGNVGIGTPTPSSAGGGYTGLDIRGTTGSSLVLGNTTTLFTYIYAAASAFTIETTSTIPILFNPGGSERMRITSGGEILAGSTSAGTGYVAVNKIGSYQGYGSDSNSTSISSIRTAGFFGVDGGASSNNQASYTALTANVQWGAASNPGAIFRGYQNTNLAVQISYTGNLANTNGSYGTLASDIRLKENIKQATSKLNDLLKLNVVNFNFINNEQKHIGFIAQELREVFPSFVYQSDTREFDEEGNVISGLEDSLGIKVGMEFAILVKAIQELKAEIDELKNK